MRYLEPINRLIGAGEFEAAIAHGAYYPQTPKTILTSIAAQLLAGMNCSAAIRNLVARHPELQDHELQAFASIVDAHAPGRLHRIVAGKSDRHLFPQVFLCLRAMQAVDGILDDARVAHWLKMAASCEPKSDGYFMAAAFSIVVRASHQALKAAIGAVPVALGFALTYNALAWRPATRGEARDTLLIAAARAPMELWNERCDYLASRSEGEAEPVRQAILGALLNNRRAAIQRRCDELRQVRDDIERRLDLLQKQRTAPRANDFLLELAAWIESRSSAEALGADMPEAPSSRRLREIADLWLPFNQAAVPLAWQLDALEKCAPVALAREGLPRVRPLLTAEATSPESSADDHVKAAQIASDSRAYGAAAEREIAAALPKCNLTLREDDPADAKARQLQELRACQPPLLTCLEMGRRVQKHVDHALAPLGNDIRRCSGILRDIDWSLVERTGPDGSEHIALFDHVPPRPRPPEINDYEAYCRKLQAANSHGHESNAKIILPSTCVHGFRATLYVQLTALPASASSLGRWVSPRFDALGNALVDVVVTAGGFAIHGDAQRGITVRQGMDSSTCELEITPREYGEREIEIEFYENGTRIGHAVLETYVLDQSELWRMRTIAGPANVTLWSARADGAIQDDHATLHVTWMAQTGTLVLRCLKAGSDRTIAQSLTLSQAELLDYLREMNAFLTEAAETGNPSDSLWANWRRDLAAKGSYLAGVLIPPEMHEALAAKAGKTTLAISTNEQWIPWELLFSDNEFWSIRFLLIRHPRKACLHSELSSLNPWPADFKISRVVNVVDADLPANCAGRASALFSEVCDPGRTLNASQRPMADLAPLLHDASLLHLGYHGSIDPGLLRVAKNRSQVVNSLLETVRLQPAVQVPFVFANACSPGAAAVAFGSIASFGWEFHAEGVGTFIGTLGPIPQSHAIEFAHRMYANLQRGGMTVGEAFLDAKSLWSETRNMSALLYCLYGGSSAKLEFSSDRAPAA